MSKKNKKKKVEELTSPPYCLMDGRAWNDISRALVIVTCESIEEARRAKQYHGDCCIVRCPSDFEKDWYVVE